MTRRDYIFLAEVFRHSLTAPGSPPLMDAERHGIRRFARDMAWALAQQNVRFDQPLFLRNCGVYGEGEVTNSADYNRADL